MAYTKFKAAWSATDELTAEAWNHIETQGALAKIDIDAHNHDTEYYTKTLANATFFSKTFYTGFDADLLDGQHFSELISNVMPVGAIMIWSGTDATVPSGWHIADGGTYGSKVSPDLRDRFVIGAGDTYDPSDLLGPATWNGTCATTGTVTIGDHTLSTAELPAHTHTYTENYNVVSAYAGYGPTHDTITRNTAISNQDEAGGDAHGHTGSTFSGSIDPRPLYYSLYYIFKYA